MVAATGLLTGLTAYFNKRSQAQREELDQLRKDYRHLRQQLRLADQWTFKMIRALDQRGITVPEAPEGLVIAPGSVDAE